MSKRWLGFDRRLEPPWLDFIVDKIKDGKSEEEIKEALKVKLSSYMKGKEAIAKTITVIGRLFFSTPDSYRKVLELSLPLLYKLPRKERIWIYWGLLILRYPFVKDVSQVTGKIFGA